MNVVKFYRGTKGAYDALPAKDPNAFYDTPEGLYLGEKHLIDENALINIVGNLDDLETSDKSNLVAATNLANASSGSWKNF